MPPGEYSLFIDVKSPQDWTLIVSSWGAQARFDQNDKTALWGAYGYTPDLIGGGPTLAGRFRSMTDNTGRPLYFDNIRTDVNDSSIWGTTIDIESDGTVKIASVSGAAGREAQRRIELITADVEVGRVYEGKVARLMDFGAFVTILPGRDGLVHISQISDERVERVSDKLKEGDVVRVKVLEVDRQGRVRLSMRNVDAA